MEGLADNYEGCQGGWMIMKAVRVLRIIMKAVRVLRTIVTSSVLS